MAQAKRSSKTPVKKKTASQAKATASARSGKGAAASKRANAPARPARTSARTTVVTPQTPAAPSTHAPLLDEQGKRDVEGLVLAVIGVALLIAVISPNAGILAAAVSDFLAVVLGKGAFIIPVALIVWSLTFFARTERLVPGRVAAGLGIIALGAIALFGICTAGADIEPSVLFDAEVLRARGGYVGNGLAWVLLSFLGRPIGIVVLVGVIIAGLIVLGFSASDTVQRLAMRQRERREMARAQSQVRAARSAREQQQSWFDRQGADAPAGWAPTALFDPNRPITDGPESAATSLMSERRAPSRARSFGCGNLPLGGDASAATELLDASWDDAADEIDAYHTAAQTTFLQPASEEDDFEEQLREYPQAEYATSLDTQAVPPVRACRANSKPTRANTWWDEELEADRLDDYLVGDDLEFTDVPVPGLIEGVVDKPPFASQRAAGSETQPSTSHFAYAYKDKVEPEGTPAYCDIDLQVEDEAEEDDENDLLKDLPPVPPVLRPVTPVRTRASRAVTAPETPAAPESASLQTSGANMAPAADILKTSSAADRVSVRTRAAQAVSPQNEGDTALPWETASVPPVEARADEPAEPHGPFVLPDPSILRRNSGGLTRSRKEEAEIEAMAANLQRTLTEFGVKAEVVDWVCGPTCTTYEVNPGEGVRVNKFTGLEDDIARALARQSVRVYAPVPNTSYIGIEVPNKTRQTVLFGDVLPYVDGGPLDFAVGLDANGKPVHADLAKLPHLLIAGTTGSGKSVVVNTIVMSMLMRDTPDDVRLIMVDPKQVEFKDYNGIPHLIMPVVTDMHQAAAALQWGVTEMDRRYRVFSNLGVRDLERYNRMVETSAAADREFPLKHLPSVVIIIDELADLMMVAKKDVEASIVRIAQLGRACGIHLVMATQSPRADVVTGLIRANVANRIGLKVAKKTDSQIAIDQGGSEKLLGHGDMLFLQTAWGDRPRRIQGCYLSDEEIAQTVEHLKGQAMPDYDIGMAPLAPAQGSGGATTVVSSYGGDASASANDDDPLAVRAAHLVVESQLGSTSMLQRQLKVGYARAGRVMDMLEEMGIVGRASGSKPREVLVRDIEELETILGERL